MNMNERSLRSCELCDKVKVDKNHQVPVNKCPAHKLYSIHLTVNLSGLVQRAMRLRQTNNNHEFIA